MVSCKLLIVFLLIPIILSLGFVWWDQEKDIEEGVLVGKNVFVTGASSGIGEETAYQFAKQGANVVITARRENLLQKVVEKCQALSREAGYKKSKFSYVIADMNTKERLTVVQQAVAFLGGLDYLILNHGYMDVPSMWTGQEKDFESFQKVMNVNLFSQTELASHALPHLNKTNGAIHVVSSFLGRLPVAYYTTYAASKAALDSFFIGLREEIRRNNTDVSVTLGIVGLIDTQPARVNTKIHCDLMGLDYEKFDYHVKFANVTECATSIMRSTVNRQKWMYFPKDYPMRLVAKLNAISPDSYEIISDYVLGFMKKK